MTEQWRAVVGYEGLYEVSDAGRVRSLTRKVTTRTRWGGFTTRTYRGRLLKTSVTRGYRNFGLSKDGVQTPMFVHRAVAEAFIGPCPSADHEVNHINGDRTDNRATNLEWVTRSDNMDHRTIVLAGACGIAQPHAKLNDDAVRAIRASSLSTAELAREHRVSWKVVDRVRRNKGWRHVGRATS